jgi:hypothetical protein
MLSKTVIKVKCSYYLVDLLTFVAYNNIMKVFCKKCQRDHADTQKECYCCENCGANVKQLKPSDDPLLSFPIFECINKKCKKRHFWD